MAAEHRYAFAKSVEVALAKQAGIQSCPVLLLKIPQGDPRGSLECKERLSGSLHSKQRRGSDRCDLPHGVAGLYGATSAGR
jgi:hypothetical protein